MTEREKSKWTHNIWKYGMFSKFQLFNNFLKLRLQEAGKTGNCSRANIKSFFLVNILIHNAILKMVLFKI